MADEIIYDDELTLGAPSGGVLKCIAVTVEIEPKDAGCLTYGARADGKLGFVEVRGPKAEIDLPFAHPEISVKYLSGLTNLKILTRAYQDFSSQVSEPRYAERE
jgi:hypothetical protein